MRRSGVLLVATALVAAGCGVPAEHDARQISDDRLPPALQAEHVTTTTVGTELVPLDVWYVRDNRLIGVEHQVEGPLTPAKALTDLTNGPAETGDDATLRSAIPDPQVIVGATVVDGTAVIELDEDFNQVPTADQALAIGQLVLTLTGLAGVDAVRFKIGPADVAVPLPDGTTSTDPVTAEDFTALTVA